MTPRKLSFTPALPCVDCEQPTQQGLIYSKSSLAWQLLPRGARDIKEPAGEEEASSTIADLQQLVTHHLQVIHQLQRRRRHLARAYLHLCRQHAHNKARRALRIDLSATDAGDGGGAVMIRDLYANNYPQRRLEALICSEGQCEHVIDGKRCPNRLGCSKSAMRAMPVLNSYSFTTRTMIPGIRKQSCWLSVRAVTCGCTANRSKMGRSCRGNGATE